MQAVFRRSSSRLGYNEVACMTIDASPSVETVDPMLTRIVEALEEIRAEEFDYEVLRAASDVMGEDMLTTWRPSLSYLPPEERDGEYHVTVYAKGACESCPIKSSHVASIEPKVRALVGADNVFVHDYFDWFDTQFSVQYGD
jgi:hypothetical protein